MQPKYSNPYAEKIRRGAFHFLLWQIGYYNDRNKLAPIPEGFSYPNEIVSVDPAQPTVTWVNHSTFWVQNCGKSLLVDPIWNKRCSPFSFVGPKRRIIAKPPFDEIAAVDYVVISHNHYDHLDKWSIARLSQYFPQIVWIVPKGVKKCLSKLFSIKKERIIELEWWQTADLDQLKLTAVPAQHFSGRGLFDSNRSLWMGCVGEFGDGKKVYFAGDTGYNEFDFKKIGKKFHSMDLSLLPIGVYAPRKFMKIVHVNPSESILIHQEVESKLSVGGHWGTFRLSSEGLERPPYDLFCALDQAAIDVKKFRVLKPGQSINW